MKSKYIKHAQKVADEIGVSVAAVRLWRRTGRKPVNPVIAKLYAKSEKGLK